MKQPDDFFDHVKLEDRHWVWTGSTDKGRPKWNAGGNRYVFSHVEMWRRIHGQPSGKLARMCDNPLCVNPNHHELLDLNLDRLIAKQRYGCWVWMGQMTGNCPTFNKPIGKRKTISHPSVSRQFRVAKFMWQRAGRELKAGQVLVRTCRNLRCVNPDHCRAMSASDAAKFGLRSPRFVKNKTGLPLIIRFNGMYNGRAKLSLEKAACIRKLYKSGGFSQAQLGRAYGVHEATIRQVVLRNTWGGADAVEVSENPNYKPLLIRKAR